MTQRKISYLELDKYEPSMDDIKAICNFFHISADYLLNLPKNLFFHNKTKNTFVFLIADTDICRNS